jgi:hypothetical protein
MIVSFAVTAPRRDGSDRRGSASRPVSSPTVTLKYQTWGTFPASFSAAECKRQSKAQRECGHDTDEQDVDEV